jgi:hypothetical protein
MAWLGSARLFWTSWWELVLSRLGSGAAKPSSRAILSQAKPLNGSRLGTYHIGLEAAEPRLKPKLGKANIQFSEGRGSMQLLAHRLAHIHKISMKCYSYARKREKVHKVVNLFPEKEKNVHIRVIIVHVPLR